MRETKLGKIEGVNRGNGKKGEKRRKEHKRGE